MKARRLTYSGRVQGVGFRYSVKQLVTGYDVSGYVRNRPDGTVELWLQGEDEEIDALEKAIAESHLLGFIQEVTADNVTPDASIKGFQIR
ncbi:MAG: acylphosphatase [Verrucomicrobiota bacterium]